MCKITTRLLMYPVEHGGCWKIEASIHVKGKREVLLRQGEYGSEKEAQDDLDRKIERWKITRMKNE